MLFSDVCCNLSREYQTSNLCFVHCVRVISLSSRELFPMYSTHPKCVIPFGHYKHNWSLFQTLHNHCYFGVLNLQRREEKRDGQEIIYCEQTRQYNRKLTQTLPFRTTVHSNKFIQKRVRERGRRERYRKRKTMMRNKTANLTR